MNPKLAAPWNKTRQRHRNSGRSRRAECSRTSHGETICGSTARDPLALLEESNLGRVEHLVSAIHANERIGLRLFSGLGNHSGA